MTEKSNFLFNFALGGVLAGISKTIVAPIERVKLLLQLQDAKKGMENPSTKYKGIVNCFIRVNRDQGFASFWRGNLSNVIRYFPIKAFNFAFYDSINRVLPRFSPKTDFWKFFMVNLASGGLAGSLLLLIVYPLDFIRTRLATDIGKTESEREFKGMIEVVTKTLKSDGVAGIYRGFSIAITETFIPRALYFGVYDTGRHILFSDLNNANFIQMWAFAQAVTATSGLLSYPLDTVKRRMMMQSGRSDVLYSNPLDCVKKMYTKEGGLKPFFKGGLTNIFRSAGGALVLVFYSEFKAILI